MTTITLQNFINHHPPGEDLIVADTAFLDRYRSLVPDSLIELWGRYGFGLYHDGLIQLVNPDDYKENLWGWLMLDEEDNTRLPIAMSAFGLLFYYRNLNEDYDGDEDEIGESVEDVAFLDPHTSHSDVTVWSLNDFFNEFICDKAIIDDFLETEFFEQAVHAKGPLQKDQIYYYGSPLRLGGKKAIESLDKGSAPIQLDILLQLASQT